MIIMDNKKSLHLDDAERLRRICKIEGITLRKLSEEIGNSEKGAGIYNVTGGKYHMTERLAKDIHRRFPKYSLQWLFDGSGEMLAPPANAVLERGRQDGAGAVQAASMADVIRVPIINLDACGCFGDSKVREEAHCVAGTIVLGRDYAREGDVAVSVVGDSMCPKYTPGSIIIIRPLEQWREYIEYGASYVVELNDGQRMLKNIAKSGDKDTLALESVNEAYAPVEVRTSVIMRLYRVVLCIRRDAF